LFFTLIKTLGEIKYFGQVLAICLVKSSDKTISKSNIRDLREFCINLVTEFSISSVLGACYGLLNMVIAVDTNDIENEYGLFDVFASKQKGSFEVMKNTVSFFVDEVLGLKKFTKMSSKNVEATAENNQLKLIEIVLKLMTHPAEDIPQNYHSHSEAHCNFLQSPSTKFTKYSKQDHWDVIFSYIRRQSLQIMTERIQTLEPQISTNADVLFSSLSLQIKDMVLKMVDPEELILGFNCIATMVIVNGDTNPTIYISVIQGILQNKLTHNENLKVVSTSLKCIRSISKKLGMLILPILSLKAISQILSCTDVIFAKDESSEMLRGSKVEDLIISALNCYQELLVQVSGSMVSSIPKMLEILAKITGFLSSKLVETHRNQLIVTMAKSISLSSVVPLLRKQITKSQTKEFVDEMLLMVNKKLSLASTADVVSNHSDIFLLFIGIFDSVVILDDPIIEDHAVEAWLEFTIKLNETLFRPLFLKIVAWAGESRHEKEIVRKQITLLYHLVDNLLGKLKAIFTPYCGYLVDGFLTELEFYATTRDIQSWKYVISSLFKFFLYGNLGIFGTDSSASIAKALIAQIDVGSNEEEYMPRMKQYIIPCIAQLATAGSEPVWKVLNTQILERMKSDDVNRKITAVLLLTQFYEKVGEDFLVLLPETVPAISELMEDDDDE
ncbi:snoRNA-binding rRNA-processing protein utp10, partial [Nowakowskiella sp. JEL0078]